MNRDIVDSTETIAIKEETSTSERESIPILTGQEALPLNKNKPWRQIIRRLVSDGKSDNENL